MKPGQWRYKPLKRPQILATDRISVPVPVAHRPARSSSRRLRERELNSGSAMTGNREHSGVEVVHFHCRLGIGTSRRFVVRIWSGSVWGEASGEKSVEMGGFMTKYYVDV